MSRLVPYSKLKTFLLWISAPISSPSADNDDASHLQCQVKTVPNILAGTYSHHVRTVKVSSSTFFFFMLTIVVWTIWRCQNGFQSLLETTFFLGCLFHPRSRSLCLTSFWDICEVGIEIFGFTKYYIARLICTTPSVLQNVVVPGLLFMRAQPYWLFLLSLSLSPTLLSDPPGVKFQP
jgi:hypothetical protein